MNSKLTYRSIHTSTTISVIVSLFLVFLSFSANAQEHPPRPMIVKLHAVQNLSFGAFIQGNVGGQVIIDSQGSRTVTGDLIPANMGYSYFPAIFQLDAFPGSVITILFGSDVDLPGDHGGTITLSVNTSLPHSPFITKTASTLVRVGGTLTVGDSAHNPAGVYFGTFAITFIQQ
ncbi:MAG: DUF4402 domain-containing protein [Bacteroidales bacterium]|nr:DUF4402 domain-containing protein [Bacteroidales bacterium]